MKRLTRRGFLHAAAYGLTATAAYKAGSVVTRATGVDPSFSYSDMAAPLPAPITDLLTKEPVRTRGDLDQLPWFVKDDTGAIRLKDGMGVPPIVDVHAHLGWSYGWGGDIDMNARGPVSYFFDYDTPQEFLLEQFHPTDAEARAMGKESEGVLLSTPARNRTHTAANLLAEMERFNYKSTVLLPIELPVSRHHSERTLEAARMNERLIPFTGLYPKPWNQAKETLAGKRIAAGARGVKFHPEFQFMGADAPAAMKMFDWCAENDVLVLAHTGFTGREPAFMRAFAEPERFAPALKTFKKLRIVLAHTGSRKRLYETLALARQFEDQVWLEFSGQPVPAIRLILEKFDTDKIVYGSDWPYYPLEVSLARFLVATEGYEHLREKILHDNAVRLLGSA